MEVSQDTIQENGSNGSRGGNTSSPPGATVFPLFSHRFWKMAPMAPGSGLGLTYEHAPGGMVFQVIEEWGSGVLRE